MQQIPHCFLIKGYRLRADKTTKTSSFFAANPHLKLSKQKVFHKTPLTLKTVAVLGNRSTKPRTSLALVFFAAARD
jgi:hypothetical protein